MTRKEAREELERKVAQAPEFRPVELEFLEEAYKDDPSNIICPACHREKEIEVFRFVDTWNYLGCQRMISVPPKLNYTAILYCHYCNLRGHVERREEFRSL